jgi:hypothetical protein
MMIKKLAVALSLTSGAIIVAETAQAPTLQLNGFTAMVAAGAFQGNNSNGQGGAQHIGIGASNIFFTAKGVSASGFQYKYRAAMEAYPGGKSGSNGSLYFTQNYLEFALASAGVFQIGNLTGPEDTMRESALELMGGAGGIDGTVDNVINTAEGVIGGVSLANNTSKATKVVYYTPTMNGVMFGVAYTPNTTRAGSGGRDNSGGPGDNVYGNSGIYPDKSNAAFGMNNVSVAVNYKKDFATWNMALAAIGVYEDSKRGRKGSLETDDNLEFFQYTSVTKGRSAQFTAAVGFNNWRFAGGLIFNGKSRLPKTSAYSVGDAGKAYNIGAQYTIGAYQFALGYFKTTRDLPKIPAGINAKGTYGAVSGSAQNDIVTATVDFNALQGLKFFGEVDFFKSRTNANYAKFVGTTNKYQKKGGTTPTTDNQGAAVIIGTKLSF